MTNTSRNRKSSSKNDSPPASIFGRLKKVEIIGIGLLLFAIFLYALTRCGGDKRTNTNNVVATEDSTQVLANNNPANTYNAEVPENAVDDKYAALRRTLFVCIDNLKLRSGPHLDSTLVKTLKFGEEVTDMGKISDFEQTLRISAEQVTTEPWVKIRTKTGETGWVYGAGVKFYPVKKNVVKPATTTTTSPSSNNATSTVTTTPSTNNRTNTNRTN